MCHCLWQNLNDRARIHLIGITSDRDKLRRSTVDEPRLNRRQYCVGHRGLRASERCQHRAARIDNLDVRVDRMHRIGAVDDHQIATFFLQLGQCPQTVVVGFERETYQPLAGLLGAERGDNIWRLDQVQCEWLAGFGDFPWLDMHGSIIARGRHTDQAMTAGELALTG